MTNTENLYERIAEQEGCHYERGAFLVIESSDWYSVKEFCFVLIEKYKLDVTRELEQHDCWRVDWWINDYSDSAHLEDKNLENAVMLAALSISEGE